MPKYDITAEDISSIMDINYVSVLWGKKIKRIVKSGNLYNKSRQVKWRIYETCLQELYEGIKRAGM